MLIRRVLARLFSRTLSSRASWPKLAIVVAVLIALPALAYSHGFGPQPAELSGSAREVVVENLDQSGQGFNLVLKEKDGPRRLSLAIGIPEAASIVQDLKLNIRMPRPATAYQMTSSMVDSLGARVQHVVVNNVNDQTFYAKIVMTTENRQVEVDAAPSDAIALAMRSHVPIYVEGAVLEKAGIVNAR
jgi:bifunctional DNase/RNase